MWWTLPLLWTALIAGALALVALTSMAVADSLGVADDAQSAVALLTLLGTSVLLLAARFIHLTR